MPSLEAHIKAFWAEHPGFERTPENEETVRTVNLILDQFAHYDDPLMPHTLPLHRRYLHTVEFARDYLGVRFGELGRAAGEHHIRLDTGGLPTMADYALGIATPLGTMRVGKRDR